MFGVLADRASKAILRSAIGRYERLLERELVGSCASVLDIGCGSASPIRGFSHRIARTVGVDAWQPDLDSSRAAGIHSAYHAIDALQIGAHFTPGSFDAVIALDVIEHLPKPDGFHLLSLMEQIARKKVVIMTPNGFLPQRPEDDNHYQEHLSGWTPAEMRRLGYRVIGLSGWRPLRGEHGRITRRPRLLWEDLSLATTFITEQRPDWAFQILCVKQIT
jgi:SAM-dependent methyltransferase